MSTLLPAVDASDLGFAHFREQQTAGANGGNFVSANWRTRILNTTIVNTISGASLVANAITLPIGVYDVSWTAPGVSCGANITRLFNVTAGAVLALGQTSLASTASTTQIYATGASRITLGVRSEIRIEHWCGATRNTDGFGRAANLDSQDEVYAEIWIKRVA